ncbi:DNA polymerase III subunit gamma/tau [Candidatus Dojkabacteria bacterium]|nr:DNA polymerase III subunit gamma/tau [Candidatus Dojkabacteria bacterium]
MSKAIYQKYRPQTFSEVLGHDLIKKVLLNSLKNENLSHAVLFTGPRGTGKTSMARLLAKGLNCSKPKKDGDCCGECTVCKQVEMGSYIDLVEIDAASNRGIEEIRALKEKVNFAPAEGDFKVYIIDEVHMLTKEAFNALLKTLEEPPSFVVFVLATTEPHKIPMTILSRVQRFDLKLAAKDEILKKLLRIAKNEGVKVEKEAVEKMFELSGGSYRDSESLFSKLLNQEIGKDKEIDLKDVEDTFGLINQSSIENFAKMLLKGEASEAMKFFRELFDEGYAVDQLVFQTIHFLRGMIREVMEGKSDQDLSKIVIVLSKLSTVGSDLRTAQVLSLPLEVAILELGETIHDKSEPPKMAQSKTETQKVVSTPEKSLERPDKASEKTSKKKKSDIQERKGSSKVVEGATQNEKEESVQSESVQDDTGKLSLDQLSSDWDEIITTTKGHNHHLYAFLSKAKLNSFDGSSVLVDVPYKFHKQKIESRSTRDILTKIFMDKYGIKILVKCEVDPALIEELEKESEQDDSNESIVEEVFNDL